MKKKFLKFLASVAVAACCVMTAACDSAPAEHEHVWNDGEVTVQPSCKDEGLKTYSCTVNGCNETKTEPIDKTVHSWDGGKITAEPTCKDFGEKTFTCGECGEKRTEAVDKAAHSYGKGTLTTVPTLTEKGETTYKCGVCGDIKKQPVEARDDFAEHFYTSVAEASVWQYGYAEDYDGETGAFAFKRILQTDEEQPSVWKADGVAISKDKIYSANNAVIAYPADGDMKINLTASFTGGGDETLVGARLTVVGADGSIKVEPVAMDGGEKDWTYATGEGITLTAGDVLYILFVNGGSGEPGGAFGCRVTAECRHSWGEGVITTPATCHSDGVITRTCGYCGAETTESITERPEHSLGGLKPVEGGHAASCENEGCDFVGEIQPHKMHDGEIIKPPSATERGEKESICSDCGYTEIIYLPTTDHTASGEYDKDGDYHWNICGTHPDCGEQVNKQPHDFKELVEEREEATCKQDGKSYWECVCGATKEEIISKDSASHSFGEWAVTSDPTFYAEGVKTRTCEVCGATETESVAKINSLSVDVNDENWKFGVANYHFPEDNDKREYLTFTQITDKNAGGDGYAKDGTEIKNGWFGAGFDTYICVAYTFTEAIDADICVTFKGVGGTDGVLSDYSLRIGYNGDTPEWGDRGTDYTVEKSHSFNAGDTVYFVFKHEKDGWDQGNYSITINRVQNETI